MRKLSWLLSSSSCAVVALVASGAAAHIELIDPPPRYELPANKSCPCGDGDSNRQCDVPAEESTDPNRSTTVTTLEAGSTITVRAEEYIDHAGRMRVAFDPDGADLADFNENILMDVPDPSDSTITTANPKPWEFEIKVPDEPCDNCTLQVIQVMQGGTETPTLDPAPLSTYYTCADIRIVAAGTDPDAPSGAGGAAGAAGAGGAPDANGGGAGGVSAGAAGSPSAGAGAAEDADDDLAVADETDDGGCSLESTRAAGSWGLALAPLGLLALLRLRRRSAAQR